MPTDSRSHTDGIQMTGCRESLDRLTSRTTLTAGEFRKATKTIEELTEAEKRKQKSIDRIAWKAEAAQRIAKGGHWK